MVAQGLLQGLAQQELDALLEDIRRAYRPGALEALVGADPGWRRALADAEREVGLLYQALGEADTTLGRWHRAIDELRRLWVRAAEASTREAGTLEEVA